MHLVMKSVARSLLVVLLVTVAVVALMGSTPGSVTGAILGETATPEQVAALEAELGLDQPLWRQYLDWIGGAVQGDLGNSMVTSEPVMSTILERLPVTLQLAAMALVIALTVSILMAVVSASRPGSLIDRALNAVSSMFLSIPAFVAGPILIYFLAMKLGWFPVLGWSWMRDGIGANLLAATLPALAIALTEIAAFHRLLRTDLISTLREDFVGAARAKGMSPTYVMFRHALRPSSFSLITLAGINLGRLIGGTVIVETLFALPGLGQLLATSIVSRDVVVVQGVVVFIAVAYVLINTAVDLSYRFIDPRLRKVTVA